MYSLMNQNLIISSDYFSSDPGIDLRNRILRNLIIPGNIDKNTMASITIEKLFCTTGIFPKK